jgi:hypothetical protein
MVTEKITRNYDISLQKENEEYTEPIESVLGIPNGLAELFNKTIKVPTSIDIKNHTKSVTIINKNSDEVISFEDLEKIQGYYQQQLRVNGNGQAVALFGDGGASSINVFKISDIIQKVADYYGATIQYRMSTDQKAVFDSVVFNAPFTKKETTAEQVLWDSFSYKKIATPNWAQGDSLVLAGMETTPPSVGLIQNMDNGYKGIVYTIAAGETARVTVDISGADTSTGKNIRMAIHCFGMTGTITKEYYNNTARLNTNEYIFNITDANTYNTFEIYVKNTGTTDAMFYLQPLVMNTLGSNPSTLNSIINFNVYKTTEIIELNTEDWLDVLDKFLELHNCKMGLLNGILNIVAFNYTGNNITLNGVSEFKEYTFENNVSNLSAVFGLRQIWTETEWQDEISIFNNNLLKTTDKLDTGFGSVMNYNTWVANNRPELNTSLCPSLATMNVDEINLLIPYTEDLLPINNVTSVRKYTFNPSLWWANGLTIDITLTCCYPYKPSDLLGNSFYINGLGVSAIIYEINDFVEEAIDQVNTITQYPFEIKARIIQ